MPVKVGKVNLFATNRSGLLEMARQDERAGIDTFFWGDHLQAIPHSIWTPELVGPLASFVPDPNALWDVVAVCATVGAATERMRVGAYVTETIRRHPATLAQEWLTLHHLTEGRAIMGIGAGEAYNILPYGLPFDRPMGKMEEALRIIRLLWETNEPVDYSGEFWKLDGAVSGLGPYEGTFPAIWSAGIRPRGLRVTGELADGWCPWGLTVDEYAEKRAVILKAAEKVGRNIDHFSWGTTFPVIIGDDREACREAVLNNYLCRWICIVNGSELFQKYGVAHPLKDDYKGIVEYIPNAYSKDQYLEAFKSVPDEILLDFFTFGTPDDIVAGIREYEKVGLNYAIILDSTGWGEPHMAVAAAPLIETAVAELSA